MPATRGSKKQRSNSDVAAPDPPKRARKIPQKYEPPAPPSKPSTKSKKRAQARSKPPSKAPTPEPSPDPESEVEGVPPSSPPVHVRHDVLVYILVTVDQKQLAALNPVIDLNDPFHPTLADFEKRAKEEVDKWSERRSGVLVYRGNWKANYGSSRDRKYCSMNSDQDWKDLEAVLTHLCATLGSKSATSVYIPAVYKTSGNVDSSSPSQAAPLPSTKSQAKGKAKEETVRRVSHLP